MELVDIIVRKIRIMIMRIAIRRKEEQGPLKQ